MTIHLAVMRRGEKLTLSGVRRMESREKCVRASFPRNAGLLYRKKALQAYGTGSLQPLADKGAV